MSLKVRFKNLREIRMGSPYQVCDIALQGEWLPPLPRSDWQNLMAKSPEGSQLALVQWNTAGNLPGFHIVRIDTRRKTIHKTRRIQGFCEAIEWDNGRFVWRKRDLT